MDYIRRPHWLERDIFNAFLDQNPSPKCKYCGAIHDLTIDHITPREARGGNELSNLQFLCRTCNSRKGTRPDNYSQRDFYWDSPPETSGLVNLREAQKQLYNELLTNPYFELTLSELSQFLYLCAWVVGSGKTLGIPVA